MLTRKLTIVAKDPAMCSGGKMLRAQVEVASEKTDPGPRGYRVHVIDYDSSQKVLYQAAELDGGGQDKFQDAADGTLLTDPAFHAQKRLRHRDEAVGAVRVCAGARHLLGFQWTPALCLSPRLRRQECLLLRGEPLASLWLLPRLPGGEGLHLPLARHHRPRVRTRAALGPAQLLHAAFLPGPGGLP